MFQYEPLIFLIILITLISFGLIVINKYNIKDVEKFRLAVTYFGAFSVLLITYNIFVAIRSNYWNEQNRIAYNTIENIQQNFLEPQKGLMMAFPEGYRLYASMNPDSELTSSEPKNIDPIKQKQVELYYAIRIFQAVDDFISTARYDTVGIPCWINTFLQWMQSPLLQKYWALTNYHFTPATNELMNNLIKEANVLIELRKKKGALNAEDYHAISQTVPLTIET